MSPCAIEFCVAFPINRENFLDFGSVMSDALDQVLDVGTKARLLSWNDLQGGVRTFFVRIGESRPEDWPAAFEAKHVTPATCEALRRGDVLERDVSWCALAFAIEETWPGMFDRVRTSLEGTCYATLLDVERLAGIDPVTRTGACRFGLTLVVPDDDALLMAVERAAFEAQGALTFARLRRTPRRLDLLTPRAPFRGAMGVGGLAHVVDLVLRDPAET